jgi:hypothetical protein
VIDWPIVALLLGTGALALGFYALRTSARRLVSLAHLEERIAKLERTREVEQVRPVPQGLRMGGPGRAF